MDNLRIALFLGLIVLSSGCLDNGGEAQGLQVSEFSATDQEIIPDQQARIELTLENYQDKDLPIESMSLFNTDFLEVSERSCTPEADEVPEGSQESPSQMECSWNIEANEEDVEGFERRNVPVSLDLQYRSVLENLEPYQVQIMPHEEIDRTEDQTSSFTNSEIQVDITMTQPISDQGTTAHIDIQDVGEGRVGSDYEMSFESDIFSDCEGEQEVLEGQDTSYTCQVEPDTGEERVENVFFDISYKYIQSPSVNIGVVN